MEGYRNDIWKFSVNTKTWITTNLTFTKPSSGLAVSIINACPVLEKSDVGRVVAPAQRSVPAPSDTVDQQAINIRIKREGLISLGLVQLPGIALGFLGIMKAFMSHGMTVRAVKDSLR